MKADAVKALPGLAAFWDFREPAGRPRRSLGPAPLSLREGAGPVRRVRGGVFGPWSAFLSPGDWFRVPRADCGPLDVHGPGARLTVVAWLQRRRKTEIQCEAVAGLWDETRRKRQYALFLDLRIAAGADQVGAHLSRTGGPTAGHRYCTEAAIGSTCIQYTEAWEGVGFTYDGREARVYRNGLLDARPGLNPYPYPGGLFDGGPDGSDFTVGAVHRSGEMGNWFTGRLGGLLVCAEALDAATMRELAEATVPDRIAPTADAIRWAAANRDYTDPH